LNGGSATASLTLGPFPSLAAAYAFDEGTGSTTADASGNGNTGNIQGATWTGNAKYGKALSFSTNASVDIGNGASLQNTGSMSWTGWIYVSNNNSGDAEIVARSNGNNSGWQFMVTQDCGYRSLAVFAGDGTTYAERCGKTTLSLRTWYYVAAVYNSSARTLDVYLNGNADDGSIKYTGVPAAMALPAVDTMIGRRSGGAGFKGAIDNLRVYNRALSTADVLSDMTMPVTISTPGVVNGAMTSALHAPLHQPTLPAGDVTTATAASPVPTAVQDLFCTPRALGPGGQASCELRVAANPVPGEIRIGSSGAQLRAPSRVVPRANQSRLTFQVDADPLAQQQMVTLTAAIGSTTATDVIQILAAGHPLLMVPDRQAAKPGTAVRFSVSAADPLDLPVQVSASGLPAGARFDASTGGFEWTPTDAQIGSHQVRFDVANTAAQSMSAEVAIDVSSGAPSLSKAVHPCSPGAIGSVSGTWLASPGSNLLDPTGKSAELGNTQVTVNGESVRVLLATPTRLDFLCPAVNAGTELTVSVQTGSGISEPLTIQMQNASPWIFSIDGGSQGTVSFAGDGAMAMVRNARTSAYPAQSGDTLVIWGSGFGSRMEGLASGISVVLGGAHADVESVLPASAYPGVYAIQIRVPAGAITGDTVPLQVQVAGSDGKVYPSNDVVIAVQPVSQ
jgi:uncharacterized protein (TIGR03437 family)